MSARPSACWALPRGRTARPPPQPGGTPPPPEPPAGSRPGGGGPPREGAAVRSGAVREAVVEFEAGGGGAAEESGVDETGPPRAAGHRNAPRRAHRREHGFGAGRDLAARARDHDADGVEQMAPRVVAHLM